MVPPEQVGWVVERLDLPEACPRVRLEEGARVGRLLDEARVVPDTVAEQRFLDGLERRLHSGPRLDVGDDAEGEQAEAARKRGECAGARHPPSKRATHVAQLQLV
jgi:hypothetical protein